MQSSRRAVIDVGTNSIKLLVADVAGLEVRPVHEESRQTRLGQGFYETRRLQPGPMAKTAAAVTDFASTARDHEAGCIKVIATSAARDALNAADLVEAIEQASGLKLEIISGDVEADWAFRGAITEPSLAREALFIADVGGGSAQFILGRGSRKIFSRSYPLGTVRLLEKFPHGDPPAADELARCREWVLQFLERELRPELDSVVEREAMSTPAGNRRAKALALPAGVQFVGTGGTASILGCMEAGLEHFDRQRLEATRLSAARLTWHTEMLWSLSLADRKRITGLPANRADVILMGSVIFEAVACTFRFGDLRVSTRGLRFAALLDP